MRTLAARLASGEDAAFAELYDACADRLHRYAAVRLGSAEAAADVVQAVFLRAVKSRRRFRDVENPVAYMVEIARNETAREAGRRRRTATSSLDDLAADEGELTGGENSDAAAAALSRLAAEDREIVELKIFAGLTFAEIGGVVGRPAATIATRYRRALESLRGWLKRQMR